MTKTKSAKLKSAKIVPVEVSPDVSFTISLRMLGRFSRIHLDSARSMAKCGRKDSARNWCRFFRNANVVQILSNDAFGVFTETESREFSESLRSLESECHPLDVPNFTTDLEEIRFRLSAIEKHLLDRPEFFPALLKEAA